MPKNIISFQFSLETNPYVSDAGLNYSINSRFVAPPDVTDATAASIVQAVGGTITTEPIVCSDSSSIKPRKLEFIRASGNSMSIAVSERENILSTAASIRVLLNGSAPDGNEVVCIKLNGEEIGNLNDELGVNFDGTTVAPSHKAPATALKQNYVSGVISYSADAAATFGAANVHPIRSITESADNVFAAQLGGTPETCIGELLTIASCGNGRRNPRRHRRYKLDFLTQLNVEDGDETPETESIELPVASATAGEILACGRAAAALNGVYCIGYEGESFSRLHRLLDNDAPNFGGGDAGA